MRLGRLSIAQRIEAVAIIVVVVAAFLTWADSPDLIMTGVQGDGIITLFVANTSLIVLLMSSGVVGTRSGKGKVAPFVLLGFAAFVVFIPVLNLTEFSQIGLHLTLGAGIVWLLAAAWQAFRTFWTTPLSLQSLRTLHGPTGQD